MARVFPVGIDLGTTNSAVAFIDDNGRSAMVWNAVGDTLTPSAVLFDDQEVVVGKEARKAAPFRADSVAQFVKRDMGRPTFSQPIRGSLLPPEVIQACILKQLSDDAARLLGKSIAVVVTVPAYFDDRRRSATASAAKMAELNLLDIVNEPTAAALAFGERQGYLTAGGIPKESMKVLVYDLGGGTFDVTLVDLKPREIRALATDGDSQLGGYDWDLRLLNHAAEACKRSHALDPREHPALRNQLLEAVIDAKHTLSARESATIKLVHEQDGSAISFSCQVTRSQFEDMTADLLERTMYTTRQVLGAAEIGWQDVSRILLVGGSTRMPMVPRQLESLSGMAPDQSVNPDEAVARGAAIYARYLLSPAPAREPMVPVHVVNVNSHSLGIQGVDVATSRRTNSIILPRNTPLPVKVTRTFVTHTADQRSIVVQVLEGESHDPRECSPVGRATLTGLPAHLPKDWPIDITYEYLTNGRLSVKATVPGSTRSVELELERVGGMTAEGIAHWRTVMGKQQTGFDEFEKALSESLGLDEDS